MPEEAEKKEVERHIKRYDRLKSDRSVLDAHLQDIGNYFLPRKSYITVTMPDGSKRHEELYDSTGEDALEFFATGLHNKMTPGERRWVMLTPNFHGPEEEEFAEELSLCTDVLNEQMSLSNFYNSIYEDYMDLGSFGTGNIFVDKGTDTALNYSTKHISEYVVAENSKGKVDTVLLKQKFTARQAVQEFGLENVGEKVRKAHESTDREDIDKEFEFMHVVEPNEKYAEGSKIIDNWHMPIDSKWIAIDDKKFVSESGFWKMRYIVHRFTKGTGEVYGRSPSMRKLPDNKLINALWKFTIVGLEQKVAPSILVGAGVWDEDNALVPNGLLRWDTTMGDKFKPEPWNNRADLNIALEVYKHIQQSITRGLFNELFLILMDDKTRTATETLEIAQTKLELLAPNFSRLKSELYDPNVKVSIDILARTGGFPFLTVPMLYKIEYISTLALALKFSEVKAFANTMTYIGPFAEMEPSILDNYSLDDISRGIAETMGMPARWLRPRDQVRAIREARMEAEQRQAALQAAQGVAEAIPKLQKKTEKGSPLEALVGVA